MKKIVNVAIMIVFVSAMAMGQNYAYVLNGTSETLSRINLETDEVENHVVTLGSVPNQVIYYEGELFVVNSYSPSLMVIDPTTNTVSAEIAMPTNSNPWNVAVEGQYAYVTGLATNAVYKVDLYEEEIVDTWTTGTSPEGVYISEDWLYVTNTGFNPTDYTYGQGSVTIWDLNSGNEEATVNVGVNPQNIIVGPDEYLNVICTGDYSSNEGMVYFIEPWDLVVEDSLSLGGSPTVTVLGSNNYAYVAGGGWVDDGYVFAYDAVNRTVVHDSEDPILVNTGVMGLAIDGLGTLYAACMMTNTVNTFTYEGSILNTFNVGTGPSSVAIIDGRVSVSEQTEVIPEHISLGLPYPNPFNATVLIPVNGAKVDDNICVEIYDIAGRLVKKLNISDDISISNNVVWSGKDITGQEVTSGVYFARVTGTSQAVKMVLLR